MPGPWTGQPAPLCPWRRASHRCNRRWEADLARVKPPLQRVTGQQQCSNLVVGDLWPFLEEVSDGVERLWGGQTDKFIDQRREPGGGIRRRDRDRQHDPLSATAAHRLNTCLG